VVFVVKMSLYKWKSIYIWFSQINFRKDCLPLGC